MNTDKTVYLLYKVILKIHIQNTGFTKKLLG